MIARLPRLSPANIAFVLFALALGMRLLHLSLLLAYAPEIVRHPVLDPLHYHRWAQDILTGTGMAKRIFFMHPLYPHVMAGVYALTGPSPVAVAVVQSILGATGVVLFFDLARRWFDDRVALVAATVLALYRPFVMDAALLETVELGVFLMLLSLWLCVRARGALGLFGAGVAFVLAMLCRGNLMFVAPALFLARWVGEAGSVQQRVVRVLPLGVGMAAVLFAVGVRNRVVGGEWVWTTSQAGQTLYLGNNRLVSETVHEIIPFVRPDPAYEEADYRSEAERRTGRAMTSREVSSFWAREAVREAAADPLLWGTRFVRKLALTFAGGEMSDNYNLSYLSTLTPLGRVPLPAFSWIVGLGALGAGLAWSRRRDLILPYGVLALYAVSLGVFYPWSRLRIFLVPFVLVFAAYALLWGIDAARARAWRGPALATGLAALLSFVSTGALPARNARAEWAQALSEHAKALGADGRKSEARSLAGQALALEPDNAFLLVNAGMAALEDGDSENAARLCAHAARVPPTLPTAWMCVGIAQAMAGSPVAAERSLRQAVAMDPQGTEPRFNLAVLLARAGRGDEARALLSDVLRLAPHHARARAALALLRRAP